MICMSFLVGAHWFVGWGRLTVLEIWMAHCVFMSGAAFCHGDDRRRERTALCDTSEYLAFVIVGIEVMFCRVKVRVQRRFYPESTLEVCLPCFRW